MKNKIVALGVYMLVFACFIAARAHAKGAGTSSGLIVTEPVSAKAAGISEAGTALKGEVLSLHYNPAGLAALVGQELSVMYQKTVSEDNFESILYGKKFEFGAIAVSVVYFDTGEIEMYNTAGTKIEKVGQRDMVASIGGGIDTPIANLAAGGSIKVISSEIFEEKATAVAVDLGAQYGALIENLNLGLVVQNLGGELKYVDEGEPLPLTVRVGASYAYPVNDYRVIGYLDIPYLVEEEATLGLFGVEGIYKELIALRVGYRMNFNDSDDLDENIDIGMGVVYGRYSVDYAVGLTDDLSNPHHVSMSIKF